MFQCQNPSILKAVFISRRNSKISHYSTMYFTITCICIVISLFIYHYHKLTSRMKRITSNMPGPKKYPFIGSTLEFIIEAYGMLDVYERFQKAHGPVVAAWIGTYLNVIVSGVNEIQAILSSPKILKKGTGYDYISNWLGNGLLVSNGEVWKKQRKLLTPAFHFKILERVVELFSSSIDVFIEKLKIEVGNNGFDVAEYIVLLTMDLIAETIMGTQINAQIKKKNAFLTAMHNCCNSSIQRMMKLIFRNDIIFFASPLGKQYTKDKNYMHTFLDNTIINRKKNQLLNEANLETSNNKNVTECKLKKGYSLLDILLDNNLSNSEIRNHVSTFMFAGHDTTTSVLTFTLYNLMKHLDIQEKIYQEQLSILGDMNCKPTFQNLNNMKYLHCVLLEVQRLYPSVPLITRVATEDFKISSEYTIPKGSDVTLNFYGLHHNPEFFPNPQVFDPDRFTPENSKGRHPFSFLPFSAGFRNCIGQKFAMLMIKSVISVLVRKYRILPPVDCPDVRLGYNLILFSKTGVYIRIEER